MTEPTLPLPGLSPVNGKTVSARFDGGSLSSDAGLLALREVERPLDMAGRLAACVDDPRDPARTLHSVADILRLRMLMIVNAEEKSPEVPNENSPLSGSGHQPRSRMGGSVFRRQAAAFRGPAAGDGCVRASVLGDEIGVSAQSVAGAFDLYDDGVVEQPVQQCGGDDRISEDLAPFGEAAVGSQDHGALLVAGVDELEEEIGAAGVNGR